MRTFATALLVASFACVASVGLAQVVDMPENQTLESDWYGDSSSAVQPATPRQIIQAKAQYRAQQRMGRIASQQWYGFSVARPRTSATPFTSMYGAAWQMPGGRPYAWTPPQVPTVIMLR